MFTWFETFEIARSFLKNEHDKVMAAALNTGNTQLSKMKNGERSQNIPEEFIYSKIFALKDGSLAKKHYPKDTEKFVLSLLKDIIEGEFPAVKDDLSDCWNGTDYETFVMHLLQRTQNGKRKKSTPESAPSSPLSFSAMSVSPASGKYFVDRPEITQKIADAFQESNVVFLSGLSGMGKSELARAYAQRHQADYDVILSLEADANGTCDFSELIKRNLSEIPLIGTFDIEKKQQYVETLLQTTSERTLIIVDNVNDFTNQELLKKLRRSTGKARKLITTQISASYLREGQYGAAISISASDSSAERSDSSEESAKQFSKDVFCSYAEVDIPAPDSEDEKDLEQILSLIGYHTMLAAILGRQVKHRYCSPRNLVKLLSESVSTTLQCEWRIDNTNKDHVDLAEHGDIQTTYDILKFLFRRFLEKKLEPIHRQVLGALILSPRSFHQRAVLEEIVGDLPRDPKCRRAKRAIDQLLDENMIHCSGETLYLHPLMEELFSDSNVTGTGEAVAEISREYAQHLTDNAFVLEGMSGCWYGHTMYSMDMVRETISRPTSNGWDMVVIMIFSVIRSIKNEICECMAQNKEMFARMILKNHDLPETQYIILMTSQLSWKTGIVICARFCIATPVNLLGFMTQSQKKRGAWLTAANKRLPRLDILEIKVLIIRMANIPRRRWSDLHQCRSVG